MNQMAMFIFVLKNVKKCEKLTFPNLNGKISHFIYIFVSVIQLLTCLLADFVV